VIDTHAHLEACEDDPEDLLARARDAGVDRVVWIAAWPETWRSALDHAERDGGLFAVLGIHPHRAGSPDAERVDELSGLVGHDRAVGVGETGLDFYRDYAPRDAQRRLFERLIAVAADLGKALVVHTRAADEETAAMLADFDGTVVLHCFSAPGLLATALDRGYYVSFAGNVTYPSAADLRDAAAQVEADRLLVETDAPFLAPQARRGRPNEPAYVVHTLATLAELRGVDARELEAQIDANARAAFALP
jgi:TatD DNase family protein